MQSFTSVTGGNGRSAWIIVEEEIPEPEVLTSPYTGVAINNIVSGNDYYLYNVESGLWLQNNDRKANDWSTRAQLGSRGLDFQLNAVDGGYKINAKFGKATLNRNDMYLDNNDDHVWVLEAKAGSVSNAVTIKSDTKYLVADKNVAANPYNNIYKVGEPKTEQWYLNNPENSYNGTWQIVAKEERLAKMANATEEKPMDATWLIKSPDFANNDTRYSSWTKTGTWARGGDANGDWGRGSMIVESFNSGDNNEISQILNVPNGKYKLTFQGFYRDGSVDEVGSKYANGTEEIRAKFYANRTEASLRSIIDPDHTSALTGPDRWPKATNGYYVPNSMADCSRCMNLENVYLNTPIEVLVTDGILKIGVKKTGSVENDWVIIDNFKLTYLTPDIDLSFYREDLNDAISAAKAFTGLTTNVLAAALESALEAAEALTTSENKDEISKAANDLRTALNNAQSASSSSLTRHDKEGVGYAVVNGGDGFNTTTETYRQLLDNDAETKFGTSNVSNAWAVIIADQPVAVKQYSLVTGADTYGYPGRNPRSWKLEGSNDNQTWTLIDARTDFDAYKIGGVNREEFTIDVNSAEKYQLFKFSATGLVNGFQLGEFWINEQAHTWGEPTETASTCTVQGTKVWECSDCKALNTEVLPLAAHTYENGVCTECGAKVSEPVILANGQTNPYTIKFRHMNGVENDVDIEAGWNTAAFDDSAWDELLMPIGSSGYDNGPRNGAKFNTFWFNEYNTYWFRRTFEVANPNQIAALTLKLLHDDAVRVFLNGTEIFARIDNEPWTSGTNWLTIDVDPSQLVAGTNVIAVYIEQNYGGAYCDFSLEAQVATVVVSDALYATYVAPFDVDFTGADVEAFAVQKNETYVHLEPVTTVPAGTAVVVKADAAGSYAVSKTIDAELGTDNDLVAATEEVTADGTQYILAKQDAGVGFAKATSGTTIAAGKGYLVISAGVKAFYPFAEEETAINSLTPALFEGEGVIYNVAGQRLNKAQKGINIVNGKKILK